MQQLHRFQMQTQQGQGASHVGSEGTAPAKGVFEGIFDRGGALGGAAVATDAQLDERVFPRSEAEATDGGGGDEGAERKHPRDGEVGAAAGKEEDGQPRKKGRTDVE